MGKKQEKVRVLFLCTGNACRSQMAEAWARELKNEFMDVYSAGIQPAGVVSSRAIAIMEEVGIDLSTHYSKGLDEWQGITFDYVVILCEHACQYAPAFPENTRVICHPVPDPTRIMGSLEQVRGAFCKVRELIRVYVESMPESLELEWKNSQP